jgi:ABC-type xylose transport system permease subunit
MHICFKIIKFLLYSTLLYMFRTLLCPSSGAFHHYTCSLWLPCGVLMVASSSPVVLLLPTAVTTEQAWGTVVFAVGSNNRTGLEDTTNTTPHGNQRLHVQWWKAPDDGHSSVRNM